MNKGKTKKQSAKATLAEVIKEMAKPRVAKSARESGPKVALVVENHIEK
jgi:TolA-binding protein